MNELLAFREGFVLLLDGGADLLQQDVRIDQQFLQRDDPIVDSTEGFLLRDHVLLHAHDTKTQLSDNSVPNHNDPPYLLVRLSSFSCVLSASCVLA